MTDHYIKLKSHKFEDDTMEIHVPWAKGGYLLMNDGPQVLHHEEDDEWDFTDQYVAPFKVKHTFKENGTCDCGAIVDPKCLITPMDSHRELMFSGATHYCDQFLFEKVLRLFKRTEYSGIKIRIHQNTFDISTVETISEYIKVLIVMEE